MIPINIYIKLNYNLIINLIIIMSSDLSIINECDDEIMVTNSDTEVKNIRVKCKILPTNQKET